MTKYRSLVGQVHVPMEVSLEVPLLTSHSQVKVIDIQNVIFGFLKFYSDILEKKFGKFKTIPTLTQTVMSRTKIVYRRLN